MLCPVTSTKTSDAPEFQQLNILGSSIFFFFKYFWRAEIIVILLCHALTMSLSISHTNHWLNLRDIFLKLWLKQWKCLFSHFDSQALERRSSTCRKGFLSLRQNPLLIPETPHLNSMYCSTRRAKVNTYTAAVNLILLWIEVLNKCVRMCVFRSWFGSKLPCWREAAGQLALFGQTWSFPGDRQIWPFQQHTIRCVPDPRFIILILSHLKCIPCFKPTMFLVQVWLCS